MAALKPWEYVFITVPIKLAVTNVTKGVNPGFDKPPLEFSGGLLNLA